MFDESVSNAIPSIWASMNSWFTPAVLFVLLNVMIGTIAITTTLNNQKQHHNNHQQQNSPNDPRQPKIARSPSVLQRLRSINFYQYRSQDPSSIPNHLKTTPDSDTHYNFEQTQQLQNLAESHSQYIFEQTHHPQNLLESHSQNIFEQTHQENQALFVEQVQDSQTHYFFQESHEETGQGTGAHFVFQQTHEENAQENQTHLVFQHAHEENAEENGSVFQFEHGQEENGRHNLNFEQAPEENVEEDEEMQSLDEVYSQLKERHVSRSKSDTKPAAGEVQAKLPTKLKKSASLKSPFKHFQEEEIVEARRPATVRERGVKSAEGADEGVDAKADDFINRFKQQLKLQRLDSIIRYKDMIGRGSGN